MTSKLKIFIGCKQVIGIPYNISNNNNVTRPVTKKIYTNLRSKTPLNVCVTTYTKKKLRININKLKKRKFDHFFFCVQNIITVRNYLCNTKLPLHKKY